MFFLSAILFSGLAFGQLPRCDLKLELAAEYPDTIVVGPGAMSPLFHLKLTNLGPDNVDTPDFIFYHLHGSPIEAPDSSTNAKKYLVAGDSMIIRGIGFYQNSTPAEDRTVEFCFRIASDGVLNYFFLDTNAANDKVCVTITFKGRPGTTTVSELTGSYFSLHPNPVSDRLSIRFGETVSGPHTVSIYDMQGRKLYRREETVSGQDNTGIDTEALAPGTYLLEIRNHLGEIHRGKFLKH